MSNKQLASHLNLSWVNPWTYLYVSISTQNIVIQWRLSTTKKYKIISSKLKNIVCNHYKRHLFLKHCTPINKTKSKFKNMVCNHYKVTNMSEAQESNSNFQPIGYQHIHSNQSEGTETSLYIWLASTRRRSSAVQWLHLS